MTEQRDKAKEESHYHKERRERRRRRDTTARPTKATQTPQKAKEESPETEVPSQGNTKEESQRREEEFKNPEKPVKDEVQYKLHKIAIPTVVVTPPALKYIQAGIDRDYHIQRGRQRLSIPRIRIDTPIFEFYEIHLNGEFVMKKVKVPVEVPPLKLHSPVFTIPSNSLDSTINISPRSKHSMRNIAKTRTTRIVEQEKRRSKEKTSPEVNPKKHETKSVRITPTQEAETVELYKTDNESTIFERETPDFMRTIFGIGSNELKEPNAAIILFKDIKGEGYIHLFEKFLLRIQREKGKAGKIKKLTLSSDDWNREEVERWLDEGGLIFIEVTNKEILNKLSRKDLADRLWAIFSKGDGVVVFHTEDDEMFLEIKNVIQDINWNKLSLKPEIFTVTSRELPLDKETRIAEYIYGFVEIPNVVPGSRISQIINTAEKQYQKTLRSIMQRYEPFFPVKSTDDESEKHVLAKYFIIHALLKRIRKERNLPKNPHEIEWDEIRKLIEN